MPSRSAPTVAVANLFADIADPATLPPELHARVNGVGEILAGLELDLGIVRAGMAASLAAAGHTSPETLGARLDSSTAELMRQVLALPVLESYTGQADTPLAAGHAENLRKLLLAVVRDGRVILIRLAERLHDLRSAKQASPERQRRLALTTREIYAPLANRLGIWQLKWELEDLAFRYLEPDQYRQVAGWLKDRR
ncbi:MAG TPA: HD domain-containing protein, partial [Gammaproteobacteria bacterium]|nr:HD domain-containing protein [Gammaproteobacteria bacterium]